MKKDLAVSTVMFACTMVLTFMTGLAHAQAVQEDRSEAQQVNAGTPVQAFVNPTDIFTAVCTIGPRSGDVIFTCFNIGFPAAVPRNVQCQLRNSPFDTSRYPDEFACQVIQTGPGFVVTRIHRLDAPGAGWGQNLREDLTIIQ